MSQSLISIDPNFPSLFYIATHNQNLPLPFAREIFLLGCYIAGTNFRPDIARIEPQLASGAALRLQREPQNEHDDSAIAIFTINNYHLGYIPKIKNEVLAKLLDAGKTLTAKLIAKEWNGSWLKLDIEVFLND